MVRSICSEMKAIAVDSILFITSKDFMNVMIFEKCFALP